MKRQLGLLALLCLLFTYSQAQESSPPLQEQIEEAFSTLDWSQVPSGLLPLYLGSSSQVASQIQQ